MSDLPLFLVYLPRNLQFLGMCTFKREGHVGLIVTRAWLAKIDLSAPISRPVVNRSQR